MTKIKRMQAAIDLLLSEYVYDIVCPCCDASIECVLDCTFADEHPDHFMEMSEARSVCTEVAALLAENPAVKP